ncbi:MAG TPA: LuxR C-terminal-related transcriptional regulator, partial [Phycicoccus sp.]|nr:LuxR C-terminal-related transcriptional regulator [Phycicoccus sp.]
AWAAGDLATAVDTFGTAVEDLRAAGNATDVLGSTVVLAGMWTARGRPDEARRLLERALEGVVAAPGVGSSVAGDLHVALADVLREAGDLAGAEHHLDVADELGDRASLPENRHRWFTVSAALRLAHGDGDGALARLDEAATHVIPGFLPDLRPVPAQRTRVLLALGRLAEARAWAGERGVALADEPTYLTEFDRLTLARLVLAEHRAGGDGGADEVDAVIRMLDAVVAAAESGDRRGSVVEATFLRALAWDASGARPAARDDLARALALGVPAGYRRIFLDEGAPAEALLSALGTADAGTVVGARVSASDGSRRSSSTTGVAGPDALSEREREVLRLLASDLSGPDIARHLYVSLNTLRTHTKHIFTKLGVTTRRAAVARGTELGLL